MPPSPANRVLGLIAALACALLWACALDQLFSPKTPQDLTIELLADSQLVVGDLVRLEPRALADGKPFAGVRFTYLSSRPTVATVDTAGRVSVLARDTFSIQVTGHSGSLPGEPPIVTAQFRGVVARVVASPGSDSLASIGATKQFRVRGERKQGDSIPGVRFTWRSDSAQVVSVDSTGRVTAVKNGGPINVIVTADGRADTVTVWVRQRSRTITITPASAVITGINQTVQFSADIRDSLGVVNTASSTTWITTASQVVSVNATGLATGTGEGIAAVIARSDGVADTARVVVSRPLQALIVTPEHDTLHALRDKVQLTARGVVQSGDTVPVPAIQWRSLDSAMATVDTAGAATAVANGTARIVGAAGGREDTVRVTVSQVLASIAVSVPSKDTTLASLQDSVRFIAAGRDSNGFAIPGAGPFTWTSDDTSVVTVASDGLVVAKRNGTTTVRVSAAGLGASRGVQVQQVIRTVDVTPARVVMLQNTSAQLRAAAFDARGVEVAGAGFSWAVRKGSVASVNSSGYVNASGANDSTYVVATSGNGVSDSALVRVGPIQVVCVGGTGQNGRTITQSETWTAVGSPHCVSGSILVTNGATLSIEAGATVQLAASVEVALGQCCDAGKSGQLRAVGTPAAPIKFTALGNTGLRGQWGGLAMYWMDQNDSLVIRNAIIEYAGNHGGGNQGKTTINLNNTCRGTVVLDAVTIREGTGNGVDVSGGSGSCKLVINSSVVENHDGRGVGAGRGAASVIGSTIRNNGGDGVAATIGSGGGTLAVQSNLIADNGGVGLRINAPSGAISGNRIRGNSSPVLIHPNSLGMLLPGQKMDSLVGNTSDTLSIECCGDVNLSSADTIRTIAAVPWKVNDARIHLVTGTVWKLEAGATIVSYNNNTHYYIDNGVVLAEGTDSNPVRFVSDEPTSCRWGGLVLNDGPDTTRLTNVEFRSGGRGRSGMLEVRDGLIVLNGVRAHQSCGEGIWVGTPRYLTVRAPVVADSNGGSGLNLSANGVTLTDSRFSGNGGWGLAANCGVSGLTVVRSEFRGNGSGGAAMCATNVTFDTNTVSGNSNTGFYINRGSPRVRGNTVTVNGGPAIELSGTTGAIITNNLIADNSGLGLGVSSPGSIARNRIRGNSLPLSIDVPALGKMAGQSLDSLVGNRRDTLFIDRGSGSVSSPTDTVRTIAALPWRISTCCDLTLTSGTIWKLEAGASVVFAGGNNMSIYVSDGAVLADGTPDAPVVFTSTDPSAGSWGSFRLDASETSDTSRFRNVELRYGGGYGWGEALWIGAGFVVLDNVAVKYSGRTGVSTGTPTFLAVQGPIVADSNGSIGMALGYPGLTIENSRFVANGSHGFQGPAVTLRNSIIQGNGGDGVTLSGNGSSTIENNLIANNAQAGLRFYMNSGGRIAGNRITGNRTPLRVVGGSLAATVPQDIDSLLGNTRDTLFIDCCDSGGGNVSSANPVRTTAKLPWRLNQNLTIASGTVWKIEPGASIVMNQTGLFINGAVIADGGSQGILIRGLADTPGSWRTLQFNASSDTSVLKNVELRNGGRDYDGSLLIEGGVSHTVTLDSVRVVRSVSGGIRWQRPVVIRRYLAADSNATYGLHDYYGSVTIPAGSFSGNGDWGIEPGAGTSLANAQINNNGTAGTAGGVYIRCCGNRTITDSRIAGNNARGIYVEDFGGDHTLRRLTIESNTSHGVELRNGAVRFTDNTVRNNGGNGIFTSHSSARFFNELSGNTITGNGGFPVILDGGSLGAFAAQDQAALLGNTKDTLCICSGPSDVTFSDGSPTVNAFLPWKNQVRFTMGGDRTLTLNPGATIVMDTSSGIWIGRTDFSQRGRLLALGKADSVVRFIGRQATAGFWQILSIENQTDSSILRHTEIAYGGGSQSQQFNLEVVNGTPVVLDTVTVHTSSSDGVRVGNAPVRFHGLISRDNGSSGLALWNGTYAIDGIRLANNGQAGLRVDGGSNHSITGSILSGNTQWGLLNNTGNSLTATGNWWGSANGPTHASNPGGTGDNVSDNVDFSGWLGAAPPIASAGLRARQLAQSLAPWLPGVDALKPLTALP